MSTEELNPPEKLSRKRRKFAGLTLEILPTDPWFLKIKKARLKAQMSQRDFAQVMGVSPVAISYWERNLSFPEKNKYQKIENVLGIKIFDGSPEKFSPAIMPENIELLLIYNRLDPSLKRDLIAFARALHGKSL